VESCCVRIYVKTLDIDNFNVTRCLAMAYVIIRILLYCVQKQFCCLIDRDRSCRAICTDSPAHLSFKVLAHLKL
jgi:hypothetical protein